MYSRVSSYAARITGSPTGDSGLPAVSVMPWSAEMFMATGGLAGTGSRMRVTVLSLLSVAAPTVTGDPPESVTAKSSRVIPPRCSENVRVTLDGDRATAETSAGASPSCASEIIWMPSSVDDATMAYAAEFTVTAVMSAAPSSLSNPPAPSVADATADGSDRSVTLIICTPSSCSDATRAYVEESIVIVAMPCAPSSSSNPPSPSVADVTAAGLVGSVTLII